MRRRRLCLAVCPEGALPVEKRDAPAFDEDAAAEKVAESWPLMSPSSRDANGARSDNDAILFPARTKGRAPGRCQVPAGS